MTSCVNVFLSMCVYRGLSVFAAGVPGCPGSSHGAGWLSSKAGAVDKCLPGCSGERNLNRPFNPLTLFINNFLLNILNWIGFFQGLGLVITGTIPVFNNTPDSFSSQVKALEMWHCSTTHTPTHALHIFIFIIMWKQCLYSHSCGQCYAFIRLFK